MLGRVPVGAAWKPDGLTATVASANHRERDRMYGGLIQGRTRQKRRKRYGNKPSVRLGKVSNPLTPAVGNNNRHTWRATGITIYLENDGRLEHAQQMAGHESPRTTKLYDRTKDEITLSEVERIRL
jgi:hypothetical protein